MTDLSPTSSGPRAPKRLCVEATAAAPPSLGRDLPRDVQLLVLGWLPSADLNAFSEAARWCRGLRADETLPQERVGEIVCSGRKNKRRPDVGSIVTKLRSKSWHERNRIYVGNRTRMKITHANFLRKHESLERDSVERLVAAGVQFNVTSLDLSFTEKSCRIKTTSGAYLARILPNLRELDLSNSRLADGAAKGFVKGFSRNCPLLEAFRWDGLVFDLKPNGEDLQWSRNLKEMQLDDARLMFASTDRDRPDRDPENHLFHMCSNLLEGISVRKLQIACLGEGCGAILTQKCLVKLVLGMPRLQWIKSDLTPENIAVLRRERPEVNFCA